MTDLRTNGSEYAGLIGATVTIEIPRRRKYEEETGP
jgi:hypothetical protein